MGFTTYPEMAAAWNAGQKHQQHIHKTATPLLTGAGYWGDMSMAAGTPKYNAYVGNQYEFTPMVGASNFGINTGMSGEKFLSRLNISGSGVASSAFPANVIVCDYVGFYPLVDMDDTDYQEFVNVADVPRHTDGLRLMIVCTTPQTAATPIQGTMFTKTLRVWSMLPSSSRSWLTWGQSITLPSTWRGCRAQTHL